MNMQKIKKGMSADELFKHLHEELKDAVRQKAYTQVWKIYGEAYMARRLEAITENQYETLWDIAYSAIGNVALVPREITRREQMS